MSDQLASTSPPPPPGQTTDTSTQTTPVATTTDTSTTTTTPESTTKPADGPILGGKDEPKVEGEKKVEPAKGAPEKYETFKVPEGFTLDDKVSAEAGTLFRELGLNQDSAQKLVDFYSAKVQDAAKAPYKAWTDTQDTWKAQIKADPEIGGKLDQVKASVGKLYDALGDPKLVTDFKSAMEFTGAGNNPAFVKAFYKLSQMVTEGGAVRGRGPVELKGDMGSRPSPAQAMYPNLK